MFVVVDINLFLLKIIQQKYNSFRFAIVKDKNFFKNFIKILKICEGLEKDLMQFEILK